MEHFGISTVEAMSAGAVPIVYRGGGQVEIVRDDENGMLWKTIDELTTKTRTIIEDSSLYMRLSKKHRRQVFCIRQKYLRTHLINFLIASVNNLYESILFSTANRCPYFDSNGIFL